MWKTHGFRRRIVHKWIQPYTTFLIFHIYGTVSPGQSMEPLTGAPYARSGRRCRRCRRRRRGRRGRAAPRRQQRCDATATSQLGAGTEALGDLAWMELDRELDGTGDRELVNDG